MSVTVTKIAGPANIGPKLKIATYQGALDSGHATGGETIDLTGDFDFVYAICPGGNDTAADNYNAKLDFVLPGPTTAVTSTNVLLTACWSADGTDGEEFVEITGSLAAIGQFSFTVFGS